MTQSDLSLIKKLAAVCRKAGISSFEGYGVKLELSADATPTTSAAKSSKTKKKTVTLATPDGDIETDAPTEDELLYWSVGASDKTPDADFEGA